MKPTTYQGVKLSVDYERVYDERNNLYRINFLDHNLSISHTGVSEHDALSSVLSKVQGIARTMAKAQAAEAAQWRNSKTPRK